MTQFLDRNFNVQQLKLDKAPNGAECIKNDRDRKAVNEVVMGLFQLQDVDMSIKDVSVYLRGDSHYVVIASGFEIPIDIDRVSALKRSHTAITNVELADGYTDPVTKERVKRMAVVVTLESSAVATRAEATRAMLQTRAQLGKRSVRFKDQEEEEEEDNHKDGISPKKKKQALQNLQSNNNKPVAELIDLDEFEEEQLITTTTTATSTTQQEPAENKPFNNGFMRRLIGRRVFKFLAY